MAIPLFFLSFSYHVLKNFNYFYYNDHLRGPVTLATIAERLAVELSLPVFTTKVYRGLKSNTQPSACGALSHCVTSAS